MRAVLICPEPGSSVAYLAGEAPLVNLPILGAPLISYWLRYCKLGGFDEVIIAATDRADQVRELIEDQERWGLPVEVRQEMRQLTAAAAAEKHGGEDSRVFVLDHLPGAIDQKLYKSYQAWFNAHEVWSLEVSRMERVGLREVRPGVWAGMKAQISPKATVEPPCWFGEHVWVGQEAVIGPRAYLENHVVIDTAAEVKSSVVGPETFIGSLTRVEDSIAWGNSLINWRTGSHTVVPDAFLMCNLSEHEGRVKQGGWKARVADLFQTFRRNRPDRRDSARMRL